MKLFFPLSTAKWKTTRRRLRRRPKGAVRFAPPLWVFVFFYLAVEAWNRKSHGNRLFLFRPSPTFGPKLTTDFGWCWPLIKNTPYKKEIVMEVLG